MTTLLDALKARYPEEVKNWDHYHYVVISPLSLNDLPMIVVKLTNENLVTTTLCINL